MGGLQGTDRLLDCGLSVDTPLRSAGCCTCNLVRKWRDSRSRESACVCPVLSACCPLCGPSPAKLASGWPSSHPLRARHRCLHHDHASAQASPAVRSHRCRHTASRSAKRPDHSLGGGAQSCRRIWAFQQDVKVWISGSVRVCRLVLAMQEAKEAAGQEFRVVERQTVHQNGPE